MSTSPITKLQGRKSRINTAVPMTLALSMSLVGCSSFQTPDAVKNFRMPESLKRLNLPDIKIAENDPSFRKRVYTGAGFGQSTLKPDTRGTVFDVSNSSGAASQFKLGMDLHNQLSVELETSVLGSAEFAQGAGTDVGYTAASLNALFYGFTGVANRSTRQGFSGYGKIGYGVVQHGSIVEPFDYSDNSIILGIGGEYGFQNGFAMRAEVTRLASDASVVGIGGIYRFGMAPSRIGQVFVNAAAPALAAARGSRTEVRDGKVVRINSGYDKQAIPTQSSAPSLGAAHMKNDAPAWTPKVTKYDSDGDGVKNSIDRCKTTALNTTVSKTGCGLFDAVLSDVTFKPGSDWLTPRARGSLDKLSVTLLAFPEARVQVRAHTDNKGPADENLGLSARRAESVVAYLMEKGIGELQLETLGLGESQPIDSNDTKEGRKRNRRVELLTLSNIVAQQSLTSPAAQSGSAAPSLGAAMPASETANKNKSSASTAASALKPQFGEPVFPAMSGVKIEPLPQSEYVAGLSLGGILKGVKFDKGSVTINSESSARLRSVSAKLKQFPTVRLVVMGHTDDQLSAEESKALSIRRANSVIDFLISDGIDRARLSAEGFGSSLPLAQNVTESDRLRNQRIELRVITKKGG